MAFVVTLFTVHKVVRETRLWVSHATIWTTILASLLTTAAFVVNAVIAGYVESSIEPNTVFSVDWGSGVCIRLISQASCNSQNIELGLDRSGGDDSNMGCYSGFDRQPDQREKSKVNFTGTSMYRYVR